MKKPLIKKKFKITLLVLLLVSILSFIGSITILYNSNYKLSNYKEEASEILGLDAEVFNADTWFEDYISTTKQIKYDMTNDINSINIIANNSDIRVYPSDSNELSLEFSINAKESLSKKLDNEDLKFDKNGGTLTFNTDNLGIPAETSIINLSMPEKYNKNLTINATSSTTSIANLKLNNLNIESYNRGVEIIDVTANTVNVKNQSGNIITRNSNFKNSNLSSSYGRIDCQGYLGNSVVKTEEGDIDFSFNKLGDNTNITTNHGSISVFNENEISDYTLNARTLDGYIEGNYVKDSFNVNTYTKKFGNGENTLNVKTLQSGVININ